MSEITIVMTFYIIIQKNHFFVVFIFFFEDVFDPVLLNPADYF